jgi:hypothetical protein
MPTSLARSVSLKTRHQKFGMVEIPLEIGMQDSLRVAGNSRNNVNAGGLQHL